MAPTMPKVAPAQSVAHAEKPPHTPSLDDIASRTQAVLDAGKYQPKDEDGLRRLARDYYMSGMLPDAYYPKDMSRRWDKAYIEQGTAKAYIAMLKGAVMGIHPSEAIWQIHVINGRPTISADLMFGRMLATGILRRDDFTLEADKTRCKIVIGVRTRLPAERLVIEAKYEDFKHLHRKENWQNDPEGMLVARCKSRACKRYAPDVFVGVYATEEARDFREDRAAGRLEDPADRIVAMVDPTEMRHEPPLVANEGEGDEVEGAEPDPLEEAARIEAAIRRLEVAVGALVQGQVPVDEGKALRAQIAALPDRAERRALHRALSAKAAAPETPAQSGEEGGA